MIQLSLPNSTIFQRHYVRLRFATLSHGTRPLSLLFPKISNQGSFTWVELSKLNVGVICCFLLCLWIHHLFPALGRRRVKRVRNSHLRNRLASVLPVVGCLVDQWVNRKLATRCWMDSLLPLQAFMWFLKDMFCPWSRSQASEKVRNREWWNAHFRPQRNQRELDAKDYSAITTVLEEPLQMVF